jgi:hypothetical protein
MRRLLPFERRWFRTVFDAILPSGASERLPAGASAVPYDGLLDELFRYAPAQFLLGLRAAVWIAYLSPLVIRLRTLAGLPHRDRVAHLERMGRSRLYVLREIPMLLKMVACLGFGALPEVQSAVGLPPAGEEPPTWIGRRLP